jgi:hypothetical protein
MFGEQKESLHSLVWDGCDVYNRVANGAEWLDAIKPNWYLEVNTEELEISSGDSCICGQVFMDEFMKHISNHRAENPDYPEDYDFENGWDYAVENFFSLEDADDPYGFASKLGFNMLDLKRRKFNINYVSENMGYEKPSAAIPKIEYELLAVEWISQIEKRLIQHKIV